MRMMAEALAGLTALVLAGGLVARWIPMLDILSILRVPAAGLLLVLGLVLPGWWKVPALGLALLVLIAWAVPRFASDRGEADLVLYQKNVLRRNSTLEVLAADIRRSGADVVTLQEIGPDATKLMELLEDIYPVQIACLDKWRASPAVLSRLPSAGGELCEREAGIAALKVETVRGPLWIASVHLGYPWPAGTQIPDARGIEDILARLDAPVVVGGDFNNVPWSGAVVRIADAVGGRPLGPWRPTRHLRLLPLIERVFVSDYEPAADNDVGRVGIAIDQVLAPGGRLELRPLLGSDHQGLLAHVMLDR